MDLFQNTPTDYEVYLNKKGRALYSNGNKEEQQQIIETNGKQLLIDLKACSYCVAILNELVYDIKKQDIFNNAIKNKIRYRIEKNTKHNIYYIVIY